MKDLVNKIRWWFKTIKGKLTIWFVGSFIISFTLFLVVTSFVFWQILNIQIDHHLHTVISEVETIWHQTGDNRKTLIESLVASQGMIVMIMAPDGEILLQTASPDTTPPAQHELQRHLVMLKNQGEEIPHHFTVNNTRYALISTPIAPNEGIIGVGFSLGVLQETFKQSIFALSGLVLIFVVMLAFLGYVLVKKALAPVTMIATTAKEITNSRDLTGRIADPGTSDELGCW